MSPSAKDLPLEIGRGELILAERDGRLAGAAMVSPSPDAEWPEGEAPDHRQSVGGAGAAGGRLFARPSRTSTRSIESLSVVNRHIKSAAVVAFDDLGTEAIRRLEVEGFPAIVVTDCRGGGLLESGKAQ